MSNLYVKYPMRYCRSPCWLASDGRPGLAYVSVACCACLGPFPTMHCLRCAVLRFARLTGDVHSLSAVDIKLLSLAHSLEVAAHGTAHLHDEPHQVTTHGYP